MSSKLTDSQLVSALRQLRDRRSELTKKYDEEYAKLTDGLNRIEVELLSRLNERGAESVRTDQGTFYIQTEVKPSCTDWDQFYIWVDAQRREKAEREAQGLPTIMEPMEFFEKRLSSKAVKAYMEMHEGLLPPAVNVMVNRVVRVRKA